MNIKHNEAIYISKQSHSFNKHQKTQWIMNEKPTITKNMMEEKIAN